MKKIIVFLLCFTLMFSLASFTSFAADEIKVTVDGEEIEFDVEPTIINGRTMVPLRAIFEYFGAQVQWRDDTKSLYSYVGSVEIAMYIERESALINNEKVTLDSPPVIIEGRTLVPVRVIAEAFFADVKWDAENKTVVITTPYPKKDIKPMDDFDKYNISTSKSEFENFDLSINKNILTISGKVDNPEINSALLQLGDLEEVKNKGKDGKITLSVNLDKAHIKDVAELSLYLNIPNDTSYRSYINKSVAIVKEGGEYFFRKPLVFDNNKEVASKWITPLAFLNYSIDEKIKAESDKVCAGIDNDYDKLKALHKWMCENIYYDYDYYNGKTNELFYSDIQVYEARKTVCGGYTNLLASMIRAQNIPCRKISGFALGLGIGTKQWTEELAGTKEQNHAWIQAYVDDRWVTIDSTWDTNNEFKDGKFNYGGMRNYLHFDLSDEFVSTDHKFMAIE